jgi:hypothetical protein
MLHSELWMQQPLKWGGFGHPQVLYFPAPHTITLWACRVYRNKRKCPLAYLGTNLATR